MFFLMIGLVIPISFNGCGDTPFETVLPAVGDTSLPSILGVDDSPNVPQVPSISKAELMFEPCVRVTVTDEDAFARVPGHELYYLTSFGGEDFVASNAPISEWDEDTLYFYSSDRSSWALIRDAETVEECS